MHALRQFFRRLDGRLEQSPILNAVRKGLTLMIPILMLGSFALLAVSLPVGFYQRTMASVFGTSWTAPFNQIYNATFGILSLVMAVVTGYHYTLSLTDHGRGLINPLLGALVSLSSFIAISGMGQAGFSVTAFGAVGLFTAFMISLSSVWLLFRLWKIPSLRMKAFTDGANASFNDAIGGMVPAGLTIALISFVGYWLIRFLQVDSLQALFVRIAHLLFSRMESNLSSGLLFVFLVHFLWFFGMHGSNILEPIAQEVFVPVLYRTMERVASGQVPTEIFSKTFLDTFVLMGGSGTILCLLLAIFVSGKYKSLKRHAKMSLLPALFNINELLILGVPIVLNPVYFIPFLSVPLLLAFISYQAVRLGLVPPAIHLVEWTTPIFLSGYTATGSLLGSALQFFNLMLGTLIYIPFVCLAEKRIAGRIGRNLEKVYKAFHADERCGIKSNLLLRQDDVGSTARQLAADLEHDLKAGRLTLFYQPQVDYGGRVFGVEALLRWKHELYGYIYPPLIISLAEEAQLNDTLENWILETACRDMKRLEETCCQEISLSVNVSAMRLESDSFLVHLKESLGKHQFNPANLKIEITEQLALSGSKTVITRLKAVKALGVKLAMDDFGMGHSSLMYLKEYEFDTIKLDGSLTREILTNTVCGEIISSIVYLSKSVEFVVVAEYVEGEEQRNRLHELGCDHYQGYLYSPALPFDDLVHYILSGSTKRFTMA